MKTGYFLIEVKVHAPNGYKPRTQTIRGLGLTANRKDKEKVEKEAIEKIKTAFTEQNKDVLLTFSVSSKYLQYEFCVGKDK